MFFFCALIARRGPVIQCPKGATEKTRPSQQWLTAPDTARSREEEDTSFSFSSSSSCPLWPGDIGISLSHLRFFHCNNNHAMPTSHCYALSLGKLNQNILVVSEHKGLSLLSWLSLCCSWEQGGFTTTFVWPLAEGSGQPMGDWHMGKEHVLQVSCYPHTHFMTLPFMLQWSTYSVWWFSLLSNTQYYEGLVSFTLSHCLLWWSTTPSLFSSKDGIDSSSQYCWLQCVSTLWTSISAS